MLKIDTVELLRRLVVAEHLLGQIKFKVEHGKDCRKNNEGGQHCTCNADEINETISDLKLVVSLDSVIEE